ncbi:phage baseplate plug family protein [Pseudomonas yamanorum]
MANFEIPLSPDPQTFSISLSGIDYRLTVQWRNADQAGWVLDIADTSANPIIQGIPLVTGVNLLEQYAYLGFAGVLWVQTTADPDAVPTFDNLGVGSHLYWWTSD